MANEFYRLDLVIGVTGDEQTKGKLKAMDRLIEHTKKHGEMLNRIQVSPAARLNDRFSRPAEIVEQHMQYMQRAAGMLDRTKIAPLLTVRDDLTDSVLRADRIVEKLDLKQASPVIAVQDRVSAVVTRMNTALEAIDRGDFNAAVGMKGDILGEITKARTALTELDKMKADPVADLSGKIFMQLDRAESEIKILDKKVATPHSLLRDQIIGKTREIGIALYGLTSKAWTVTIRAKDMTLGAIRTVKGTLFSLPAMLGLSGGAIGAGAFIKGILDASGFEEQAKVGLGVMLKSKKAADETFEKARKFADITPFSTQEVIAATSSLVSSRFKTRDIFSGLLTDVGNLAAANKDVGASITDVTNVFGRLRAGNFGEAFERLRELKISQIDLKEFGLKFSKSGEFQGTAEQAITAVRKVIQKNFGGMMEAQSKTWGGLWSTFTSNVTNTMAAIGRYEVRQNVTVLDLFKNRIKQVTGLIVDEGGRLSPIAGRFVKMIATGFDWVDHKAGEIYNRINLLFNNPEFKGGSWSKKLVSMLSIMIGDVLPTAAKIGARIGAIVGAGIAKGILEATTTDPKAALVFGILAGNYVPGPWQLKAIVTVGIIILPWAKKALDFIINQTQAHVSPVIDTYIEPIVRKHTQVPVTKTEREKSWLYRATKAMGGKVVEGHAAGGILTQPHLGLVAEDGAEAIIPLSEERRQRGIKLWQRTGELLGAQPYADGGIVENTNSITKYIQQPLAMTGTDNYSSFVAPPVVSDNRIYSKLDTLINNPSVKQATNHVVDIRNAITNGKPSNVVAHAAGGILTRTHLGMIAEAGPEAVIPLSADKRDRAVDIFKQTASVLGLSRAGNIISLDTNKKPEGRLPGATSAIQFTNLLSTKLETAKTKIIPMKPEFDIFTGTPEINIAKQIGEKIKTNTSEKVAIITNKLKEATSSVSSFVSKLVSSIKDMIKKVQVSTSIFGSKELLPLVQNISASYGLPPALLAAVIQAESGWNSRAISPAGAIGLTQVMPGTARAMGYNPIELVRNPAIQIDAGAKYLSKMMQEFKSIPLAIAAYNAGPGAVEKYGGIPPYKETQAYVSRVMSMFAKHETGGVFDKPHLGLVAEAGPEAVIPLSSRLRTRSLELWQQAGEYLGVKPYALGGFTGPVPAVAGAGGGRGGDLNVTVTGITVNMAGNEINEETLAWNIGKRIVKEIKKSVNNRA